MERILLTTDELMDKLQVSRNTLYRWRKEGLPCKKVKASIRYDYEEVLKWIDDINSDRKD